MRVSKFWGVLYIALGHNDRTEINDHNGRGSIPCSKDSSNVYLMKSTGKQERVYSFGWYLKKYVHDVRDKGGIPVLVSLTPRNGWKDGRMIRYTDTYVRWTKDIAEKTGCEFVDVHNITADFLDSIGQKEALKYFFHGVTHNSRIGALMNVQSLAKGLLKNNSPLAHYLKKDCLTSEK